MTPPLRVLQVVDGLWVGGTERSLVEMLPHFESHGIDVRIACLRRRSEGVEDLVPAERLLFVPGEELLGQARGLRRLLREQGPDLVHSSLFRANLVTRLAATGTGIPVLNSLVNDSYGPARFTDPRLPRRRLRIVQAVDVLTGRLLADHYHAVSESVAEAATRRLGIPPARITVVRRGRDPERLGEPTEERRRAARGRLGLDPTQRVIVTAGRQDFQKGYETLFQAMAKPPLSDCSPTPILLVAGREGGATRRLHELLRDLGLMARIQFLGHRDDIGEILAAADLFAFPSRYEGLPGAVLEAMALGLPVVASDIPPLREIAGPEEGIVLVPSGDACALSEALASLLQDSALAQRLGRDNRRLFLTRFTTDRSVAEMAELYHRLAGHSQPVVPR